MTKVLVTEQYLQDIGDSIRSKLDVSTRYKPSQMAAAIGTISGVSVADNGKVVVNGELVSQTSRSVTANGTYDTTTNDEVVVSVDGGSSATLVDKAITANGTYDPADDNADGYSGVTVDVPTGLPYGIIVSEDAPSSSVGNDGNNYVQTYHDTSAMIDFTPASDANSARGSGFTFYSDSDLMIAGFRAWPRNGSSVNVHIRAQGGSDDLASAINLSLTPNQWNEITLAKPVKLDAGVTYTVWYYDGNNATKYYKGIPTPVTTGIHITSGMYSTSSSDVVPSSKEGNVYGVDLLLLNEYGVESIYRKESGAWEDIAGELVDLGTKTVTDNGTYLASSDSLDGYSSFTVNVPKSDLNWLEEVSTYADIATTYPSPNTGDAVCVSTTGEDYMFDGSDWILLYVEYTYSEAMTVLEATS